MKRLLKDQASRPKSEAIGGIPIDSEYIIFIVDTSGSMLSGHWNEAQAIVQEILTNDALRHSWSDELEGMRTRIQGLRNDLVKHLATAYPQRSFSFIAAQRGMFSYLGLDTPQVRELREKHHVYMTDDSRINIAGLRSDNIAYFADAVAQVLRR